MARTTLTPTTLLRTGASLTTAAADVVNGNQFTSQSGNPVQCSFFMVTGGTVTVLGAQYVDGDNTTGIKVADRVLTIPAAQVFIWNCPAIPGQGNPYKQSDGNVYLDFSGACSVGLYET